MRITKKFKEAVVKHKFISYHYEETETLKGENVTLIMHKFRSMSNGFGVIATLIYPDGVASWSMMTRKEDDCFKKLMNKAGLFPVGVTKADMFIDIDQKFIKRVK